LKLQCIAVVSLCPTSCLLCQPSNSLPRVAPLPLAASTVSSRVQDRLVCALFSWLFSHRWSLLLTVVRRYELVLSQRAAAVRGCLRHLHQLARSTALYTSPSRIIVKPSNPVLPCLTSSNPESRTLGKNKRGPCTSLIKCSVEEFNRRSSSFRASSRNPKRRVKMKLAA
jgi:hypothetical protein